ncbi:uncharacterized protein LOC134228068 [Armigeres subalbatus]|uniref:uncharacterized protein LOC134228068 n=1 Tax=Armigeres subalbatus TaxID=124917 RepID=UPI002ED4E700
MVRSFRKRKAARQREINKKIKREIVDPLAWTFEDPWGSVIRGRCDSSDDVEGNGGAKCVEDINQPVSSIGDETPSGSSIAFTLDIPAASVSDVPELPILDTTILPQYGLNVRVHSEIPLQLPEQQYMVPDLNTGRLDVGLPEELLLSPGSLAVNEMRIPSAAGNIPMQTNKFGIRQSICDMSGQSLLVPETILGFEKPLLDSGLSTIATSSFFPPEEITFPYQEQVSNALDKMPNEIIVDESAQTSENMSPHQNQYRTQCMSSRAITLSRTSTMIFEIPGIPAGTMCDVDQDCYCTACMKWTTVDPAIGKNVTKSSSTDETSIEAEAMKNIFNKLQRIKATHRFIHKTGDVTLRPGIKGLRKASKRVFRKRYQAIDADAYSKVTIPHEKRIHGRRVVDIDYFIKWITLAQATHSQTCVGVLCPFQENFKSMVSSIYLECNVCGEMVKGSSEQPTSKNRLRRNMSWAILCSGGTYTQAKELFSFLNMPFMSRDAFAKDEIAMDSVLQVALDESLDRAVEAEKAAVLEEMAQKGTTPPTEKYVKSCAALDGSWGQRSNGHRYNSASGCAAIIATRTKKVCYVGCKNKRCIACNINMTRVKNNQPIREHKCYRNYKGASGGMEPAIIIDGFEVLRHKGLKFTTVVTDGDSTTVARLKNSCKYGPEIRHQLCCNHVMKNLGKSCESKFFTEKNQLSSPGCTTYSTLEAPEPPIAVETFQPALISHPGPAYGSGIRGFQPVQSGKYYSIMNTARSEDISSRSSNITDLASISHHPGRKTESTLEALEPPITVATMKPTYISRPGPVFGSGIWGFQLALPGKYDLIKDTARSEDISSTAQQPGRLIISPLEVLTIQPAFNSRPGPVNGSGGRGFHPAESGKYDLNENTAHPENISLPSSTCIFNSTRRNTTEARHPRRAIFSHENNATTTANVLLYYKNVGGINSSLAVYKLAVSVGCYDIYAFSETWLNEKTTSNLLFDTSYSVYRQDRSPSNSRKLTGAASC